MAALIGKLIVTLAIKTCIFISIFWQGENTFNHKTIAKQLFVWNTGFNDSLKLIFPVNEKIQNKSFKTAQESGWPV